MKVTVENAVKGVRVRASCDPETIADFNRVIEELGGRDAFKFGYSRTTLVGELAPGVVLTIYPPRETEPEPKPKPIGSEFLLAFMGDSEDKS